MGRAAVTFLAENILKLFSGRSARCNQGRKRELLLGCKVSLNALKYPSPNKPTIVF
jgi:hypothetical protein